MIGALSLYYFDELKLIYYNLQSVTSTARKRTLQNGTYARDT